MDSSINPPQTSLTFKHQLSDTLYWIRGVAIALVVIGHVIGFDRNYGMRQHYNSDLSWLGIFGDGINTIHMPVFFIASGLATEFFSRGVGSYRSFFGKKLPRLMLPLICWAPPFFIFQSLAKGHPIDVWSIFDSILEPYEIFWFLHALIFAAIFHFLLSKVMSSKWLYFGISTSLTIGSLFPPLNAFETYLYWNFFFAIGIIAAQDLPTIDRWLQRQPWWLWCSSMLICIGIITTVKIAFPLISQLLLVRLLTGIPGFIFLYLVCGLSQQVSNQSKSRWLHSGVVYVGTMSMVVYLFHGYFTKFSSLTITKLLGSISPIGYFIILCTAGIGAPLLLNILILKRISFLSYITGGK